MGAGEGAGLRGGVCSLERAHHNDHISSVMWIRALPITYAEAGGTSLWLS